MPRKIDTPIIVARYGNRVAGWVGNDEGGRLTGDAEWVQSAKDASNAQLEFTLFGDIELKADITDPKNPAGAFAALAWYTKERILVTKSPEGMLDSLGLLVSPEEVDFFEGYDGEVSEEEREFVETHLNVTIDGTDVWIPLAQLQERSTTPELMTQFLKDFAVEDEEPESEENPEENPEEVAGDVVKDLSEEVDEHDDAPAGNPAE